MKTVMSNNIVFFDVDDTLVKWGVADTEELSKAIPITCPVSQRSDFMGKNIYLED